jgi:hypothetical protein
MTKRGQHIVPVSGSTDVVSPLHISTRHAFQHASFSFQDALHCGNNNKTVMVKSSQNG